MNKNNTDIKPRIGRHYTYKEHEYIVIGLPMVKTDNGEWKSGVSYERVLKVGEQANKTYVRQADNFLSRFVPVALEVGDIVEAVSMGKSKGFMTVETLVPEDEYPIKFRNCEKAAKLLINDSNLTIEVDSSDQATEYRYVMPVFKSCKDYYEMAREAMMHMTHLMGDFQNGKCNDKKKEKIEKIIEIFNS